MVKVYIACISQVPDPKECPEILKSLPAERCDKIHKQKQVQKRRQSVAAGLLLKKVLSIYGISEDGIRLGEHGKPEIEGIHFNLSHSGDFVVCAVSERYPVGCDIEAVKEMDERVAERFFSSAENEHLNSVSEEKRNEEFMRLWTMKESYLKMTGEGLSVPIKDIELMLEGQVRVLRKGTMQSCAFKEYIVPNYRLTVCSEDAEFSDMIQTDINIRN